MNILENQLPLIGITGESVLPAADIDSPFVKAAPVSSPGAAPKLPEGWHDTEKYGPVFVSPSGTAWAVQLVGDKFKNVIVDVSPRDFIGQSAIEKRTNAIKRQVRRAKSKVSRTTPPLQPLQRVSTSMDGVSEVSA
jgi:hypothetical protein